MSLEAFGLLDCTLYTSADTAIPLVNGGGTALWTIFIPNEQDLIGVTLYVQGLSPDAGINPFGATLSNAVELVVGGW